MAAVMVDADRNMDAKDRSFPAFWLPFQDVNSHNHSAQWVETVPPPPSVDGGGPCNGVTCLVSEVCCNNVCLPSCVN
jgi:hypothetical protein